MYICTLVLLFLMPLTHAVPVPVVYGLKARSMALAVYLRHAVPVPVVHGHVGEGQRHWHMPYALTTEPRPVKTLVVHSYIK